ncbi:shikimate dehydrogenase [Microbacterium resistens]|uniref:shikimate dehydrogenase family protein n=1 Tax=Microbacterium resistens TaxID=156977 RepID=UPI001C576CDC|nr:shikimate dehydrogenase [Microbacterium resistens]MBW1637904.1 shikimate dehydrogenase [Microbacterium resistens]
MLSDEEAASRASRLLAVWGDPIDHSRSPALHGAAYRALGLDWHYGRRRVDAAGFRAAVDGLDGRWHGLSLTMPLKEEAFAWARHRDRHAVLTGAANTVVLDGPRRGHVWNTDVGGLVRALTEAGVSGAGSVRILGAGATAASALVAASELGAERVEVAARRPEAAGPLRRIAAQLDLPVEVIPFDAAEHAVDLTIATLPGGAAPDARATARLAATGGALFDVAYAPWPSALASAWDDAPALPGLGMLLHQAVLQVRVFVSGELDEPLPNEDVIVAEMRRAVMGD